MAAVPDVSRLKSGEVNLGAFQVWIIERERHQLNMTCGYQGTSIMAVTYKGGVVLGADSRTTMGSYIVSPGVASALCVSCGSGS